MSKEKDFLFAPICKNLKILKLTVEIKNSFDWVQNHLLNLCSSVVNSQTLFLSKIWCETFVLKISGMQTIFLIVDYLSVLTAWYRFSFLFKSFFNVEICFLNVYIIISKILQVSKIALQQISIIFFISV